MCPEKNGDTHLNRFPPEMPERLRAFCRSDYLRASKGVRVARCPRRSLSAFCSNTHAFARRWKQVRQGKGSLLSLVEFRRPDGSRSGCGCVCRCQVVLCWHALVLELSLKSSGTHSETHSDTHTDTHTRSKV